MNELERHDEVQRALTMWSKVFIDLWTLANGYYQIWINSNFRSGEYTLKEAEAFVSGLSIGLAHGVSRDMEETVSAGQD